MSQQLLMEADYDRFIIDEEYLNAVPRATNAEIKALDLKLIQRGQLVPITVNSKMVILDGYTRHDLLGQRGVKIKYTILDLPSREEELNFVRETNVMRRHLNIFQRVETMYSALKHEREMKRIQINTGFTDVLLSIKDGNYSVTKIARDMEVSAKYINRIIKEMTEQWYVSRNPNPESTKEFIYNIMPKGEEHLIKTKQAKIGRIDVSDMIGVHKYTISKAMFLIENASEELLEQLRTDKVGLFNAYRDYNCKNRIKPSSSYKVWTPYTKVMCPHCHQVSNKKDLEIVK